MKISATDEDGGTGNNNLNIKKDREKSLSFYLRLKSFKNKGSVMLFSVVYVVGTLGSPADHVCAEKCTKTSRNALIIMFVGNEMRTGEEIKEQMSQELMKKPLFIIANSERCRKLTANYLRTVLFVPGNCLRMEGFDTVSSLIVFKNFICQFTYTGLCAV